MWPFNARREPVHLDMQYPRVEPPWVAAALKNELYAVDMVLFAQSAQIERDWTIINQLLDERLAVTQSLTVIPGRSS